MHNGGPALSVGRRFSTNLPVYQSISSPLPVECRRHGVSSTPVGTLVGKSAQSAFEIWDDEEYIPYDQGGSQRDTFSDVFADVDEMYEEGDNPQSHSTSSEPEDPFGPVKIQGADEQFVQKRKAKAHGLKPSGAEQPARAAPGHSEGGAKEAKPGQKRVKEGSRDGWRRPLAPVGMDVKGRDDAKPFHQRLGVNRLPKQEKPRSFDPSHARVKTAVPNLPDEIKQPRLGVLKARKAKDRTIKAIEDKYSGLEKVQKILRYKRRRHQVEEKYHRVEPKRRIAQMWIDKRTMHREVLERMILEDQINAKKIFRQERADLVLKAMTDVVYLLMSRAIVLPHFRTAKWVDPLLNGLLHTDNWMHVFDANRRVVRLFQEAWSGSSGWKRFLGTTLSDKLINMLRAHLPEPRYLGKGAQYPSRSYLDPNALKDTLFEMESTWPDWADETDARRLTALRLLLVMAGIEQNPGPETDMAELVVANVPTGDLDQIADYLDKVCADDKAYFVRLVTCLSNTIEEDLPVWQHNVAAVIIMYCVPLEQRKFFAVDKRWFRNMKGMKKYLWAMLLRNNIRVPEYLADVFKAKSGNFHDVLAVAIEHKIVPDLTPEQSVAFGLGEYAGCYVPDSLREANVIKAECDRVMLGDKAYAASELSKAKKKLDIQRPSASQTESTRPDEPAPAPAEPEDGGKAAPNACATAASTTSKSDASPTPTKSEANPVAPQPVEQQPAPRKKLNIQRPAESAESAQAATAAAATAVDGVKDSDASDLRAATCELNVPVECSPSPHRAQSNSTINAENDQMDKALDKDVEKNHGTFLQMVQNMCGKDVADNMRCAFYNTYPMNELEVDDGEDDDSAVLPDPWENNDVVDTYSFSGSYEAKTFDPCDPVVEVFRHFYGECEVMGEDIPFTVLRIPKVFYSVASSSCAFDDMTVRYRNIMAAITGHNECVKELERNSTYYLPRLSEIVFVLTGISVPAARNKFLNNFPEYKPTLYTVAPPTNWKARITEAGFTLAEDTMYLYASQLRKIRGAAVICSGVVPEMPKWYDMPTNVAGILKRLLPDLPQRTEEATNGITECVDEFIQYLNHQCFPEITREQVFEEAMKGRPAYERLQMRKGFELYCDPRTRREAIRLYVRAPYKAFWKLECYLHGTYKPPRYIMTLPLMLRGIQVAAMGVILKKIEIATKICNVKGLNSDQITQKLKHKMQGIMCAESDFSSFESCITPELKNLIEHRIYRALADPDDLEFIQRGLCRRTVKLFGPGFRCNRFHHIRMSGDYWTSLGNLVTNLILMSYCQERSVLEIMRTSLFEGDDAVTPAPSDVKRVEARAKDAGVLLKFDVAPWYALSFCGNLFHANLDGTMTRTRDPRKVMMGLTMLFGADQTSRNNDLMLQRSKCLSVLDGPWVAGASAFAALFEFWSRHQRVDEQYLLKHGLLKPYGGHGVESCVPRWLAECEILVQACWRIATEDQRAGGHCTTAMLLRAYRQMDTGVVAENFIPPDNSVCHWYAHPGSSMVTRSLLCPRIITHYHDSEPDRPSFMITQGKNGRLNFGMNRRQVLFTASMFCGAGALAATAVLKPSLFVSTWRASTSLLNYVVQFNVRQSLVGVGARILGALSGPHSLIAQVPHYAGESVAVVKTVAANTTRTTMEASRSVAERVTVWLNRSATNRTGQTTSLAGNVMRALRNMLHF